MAVKYYILLFFLGFGFQIQAQILGMGTKVNHKAMFEFNLDIPTKFDSRTSYDILVGINFTTKNNTFPSGLMPKITPVYYLVDNQNKDYLMYVGLNMGYLIDINRQFKNQFVFTPHIYLEYFSIFYFKAGYEFFVPLQRGAPFVSVGIGGGHLFRHFKIM